MHPVGPQNPRVYWVRRVLVIVVAVAVVIGLTWWLVGRGSSPDVDPAAESVSSTTPQMTGVLASDTSTTTSDIVPTAGSESGSDTSGTTTAEMTQSSQVASAGQDSSSPAPSPAKTSGSTPVDSTKADSTKAESTTSSENAKADSTKAESTTSSENAKADSTAADSATTDPPKKTSTTPPASSTTKAPPAPSYDSQGNLICPASSVGITGLTYRGSTIVGAHPRLGVEITNTGRKACLQDVSGAAQVYTVYTAAGKRIWSTDDCFPGEGHESVRLSAGSSTSFVIVWAGTTSSPGCDTPRVTVKPGKYTLVAQLGDLKSKPHAFTMRK